MELISKRTRIEVQDYLVTTTLREIEKYFDNYDIPVTSLPSNMPVVGQRRNLISQYYASINWGNKNQVNLILKVYSDILMDLEDDSNSYNLEYKKTWFDKICKYLLKDGYQYSNGKITKIGEEDFFDLCDTTNNVLNKEHLQEHITRIRNSIDHDPSLAIGATKELVEATLKTILTEMEVSFDKDDDIPKLLKQVQKTLDLVPDDVDDAKKGADIIKILLSNLGQIVCKIAELRNLYGTGHGKERKWKGLNERHARLVVGSGITLSTFLLETFEIKREVQLS